MLRYDDWYQHTWLVRKPKLVTDLGEVKRAASELDQQLKSKANEVKHMPASNLSYKGASLMPLR